MSKVLVIPDVHLKPWMFSQAIDIMETTDCERAVFIGDLVDDWGCQFNVDLYGETLEAAISFAKRYPDSLWCYGNHDLSYIWSQYDHPGFSLAAADLVCDKFEELRDALEAPENLAIIHRVDNTLFSHAGLTREYAEAWYFNMMDDPDCMIDMINECDYDKLWENNSPIWVRPQYGNLAMGMFPEDLFQVVGHTPVDKVLVQDNMITVDTFSTTRSGVSIGNQEFCRVDTVKKTWEYID